MDALATEFPEANAGRVFSACIGEILDATKNDRSYYVGWMIEAQRRLYQKMLEAGDFAGALAAIRDINKTMEANQDVIRRAPRKPGA